jgi:DNA-binding NtrC family response regulator
MEVWSDFEEGGKEQKMSADIFVIGTDPAICGQIESVLETVGYDVACYSDIEETVGALDPGRTNLVFVDTDAVGFELGEDIERIQAVCPNMDFILIAEYQDPLIEQDAFRHGVNSWLYRPFSAPEIILKVAAVLEGATTVGDDGVPKEAESEKNHAEKSEQ